MSKTIILPAHQRLQTAIESASRYDAPDPKPSSVDQFDDETHDLEQLMDHLKSALSAAEELTRTRAVDRADLAYALEDKASREADAEAHFGVGGQFT